LVDFGVVAAHRRTVGSHEDQATQVGGSLVAQSAGGVDEGGDTIGLDGGTDDGRTPAGGRGGGLLGLEKLLLAVGGLGSVVGVAEQRGKHAHRRDLVEDDAQGDRRGLDGWEVWRRRAMSAAGSSPRLGKKSVVAELDDDVEKKWEETAFLPAW
jgi:hypothetical protein